MDRKDYEAVAWYEELPAPPVMIGVPDGEDRTLLYGYDVERRTYHVYKRDGELHLAIYRPGELISHVRGSELEVDALIPDKRLYPEACDADFCHAIRALRRRLPFTTFDPERAPKRFHGEVFEPEAAPSP